MHMIKYNPETNSFSSGVASSGDLPQIMWHITSQCNMNCRFCFDDKSAGKEELYSHFDFGTIVKKLLALGVQKVDISGGEPLLFDRLQELVAACVNKGLFVTITTNGSGDNNRSEWVFDNWRIFSRVIVSIDGLEQEHTYLRNNTSAFRNAIKFCEMLKYVECSCFRINTVVTKKVISDAYYKDFCAEIISLNPVEWCLIQPHPLCK
ncbi:MAG: radical SAM protein, partial [Gracilibacteraceae bacterium]|nr:radical SAM protein [Gracilibacteraceae bacterium]